MGPGDDAGSLVPDGGTAAVLDRDGDGVLDGVDNCPDVKNPDQADEDGDKVGDACDGCPQIADAAQTDSDADHIGDVCDPNPGAIDTRWKFEGFHTGMLPEWGKSLGWLPVGDGLQVTAGGGPNDPGEFLTVPIAQPARVFDKFSIATTIVVNQMLGSDDHEIGVDLYDSNLKRTMFCELQQLGSNPRTATIEEWDDNGTSPRTHRTAALAWKNAVLYRVTLARQARNYTCTVTGPEGTMSVTQISDLAPDFEPEVGAFGAVAQVGSVLVIGTP